MKNDLSFLFAGAGSARSATLVPRGPIKTLVACLCVVGLQACQHVPLSGNSAATPPQSGVEAPQAAGAASPAAAASAPLGAPSGDARAAAAPRPSGPGPRPFDEVVRGATRQAGFLPLWRKDEKLWIEVAPDRLDRPFLLSVNVSNALGERGLYASQMGPSWLVSLRQIGTNQIQWVAQNTAFVANSAPLRDAVEQAFSSSLIASAPVASAAHPERKSVLIDAGFLLGDIAGYSTVVERAFRMPYGLDRSNSFFEAARSSDSVTTVKARLHFATPRLPAPPLVSPTVSQPGPPANVPDPRSFFIGVVYSFTPLPDEPMPTRAADPRLGHFTQKVMDFSSDLKPDLARYHVSRWRLEKSNPDAELSEPKQPIVYWLDKNIPERYRAVVAEGVLEWNKAFERIGFRNAIVVKQQPDGADFDSLDARHASIRWFVGTDVGFAIGPRHTDPRTGEIIDADIGMSDVFGRGARRFITEDLRHRADGSMAQPHDEACTYQHDAAAEMNFVMDVLEARGDIAPDSPEAEAFVLAVIKDTVMHEVGHTLGLKHNFKASTVVSRTQLRSRVHTEHHGISGSVMDYNAYNLPLEGEAPPTLTQTTLGPYDYWAIEYAYRPIAPEQEAQVLARIAARSTEPLLAYADDTDAGAGGVESIDPLANRFDLGDDPLAYYRKRLQLSRELWARVQARGAQPGDDPLRQRRSLLGGFRQLNRAAELASKYVGGMHTVRDLPGTTQRLTYRPVAPEQQREALVFLTQGLFISDSFQFRPEFLASLSPNFNEWGRSGPVSIPAAVLQMQQVVLDRLMSPGTASRLLDLPLYLTASERAGSISLHEVYASLQSAIWSELTTGGDIDRLRRNLQREHLRRVQGLLTRGSASLPPDALSLLRLNAGVLQAQLRQAAARPGGSIERRAHVQDSLGLLTQALQASMTLTRQ